MRAGPVRNVARTPFQGRSPLTSPAASHTLGPFAALEREVAFKVHGQVIEVDPSCYPSGQ